MNSKIDKNGENTTLATDTNGDIKNLLVDPVTGRLLIEIAGILDGVAPSVVFKIDDNGKEVAVAVDDNGIIKPLLIDSHNGYLLVDLYIE